MNTLQSLIQLLKTLRSNQGCDWDKAQTHQSLIPFLREECNELIDAIAKNDFYDLKEELGDVLFQLVFHSQIAEESGEFTFEDVMQTLIEKMVNRHPHVFKTTQYPSLQAQKNAWAQIKKIEKTQHPHFDHLLENSILNDIKAHHSAMEIALQMQNACSQVGFDWPHIEGVFEKLDEEITELKVEIQIDQQENEQESHIEEEFGDALFVMMNLARHLKLDPDLALRKANHKFKKRFQYIEKKLNQHGKTVTQSNSEEMNALWLESKKD